MTALPPPYGRQPERIQVTPSNSSPWVSLHKIDGQFTGEQYRELAKLDLNPDAIEVVTVRRTATDREMYWSTGQLAPYFEFECPVIGNKRRDGKSQVITPAGFRKFVPEDGWVSKKPKIKEWGMTW